MINELPPITDPYAELAAIEAEYARRSQLNRLRDSFPPVFHPFLQPARYKGAHGGRGSAKSWTFAGMVIDRANRQNGLRVVCVREVQRTLGQSVKRLLDDTIKRFDLTDRFRIMSNHIDTPGDGIIIFQGMHDYTAESIKSLEGFDIVWVEEAQTLSARSLTMLRPTLRKDGSELWFTWNPRRKTDPVDDFLRNNPPPNSIVIQANYRDNPHLPQVLKDELEWDRRRDPEKFEHIWLGGYEKHSESRVFKNWTIDAFEAPTYGTVFYLGGDWGFSVDPTVLVRCFLGPEVPEGQHRKLFIDHEVFRIGCEIDHIPALFDTLTCGCPFMIGDDALQQARCNKAEHGSAREWPIVADSARPETISYLQRHGYPRIEAAKKGKDSVKEGVIFLQGYDIIVHERCQHTIDELTMYSYKIDKMTDTVTPVLEDKKNHVIDSLRYATEKLRNPGLDWVTF